MRFPLPLSCLLAILAHGAVGALSANPASGPQWKAGVAVVDITPSQPVWMAGYAARKKPSEGVARPLHAKALVLEDARGRRVAIITSDLLGFRREVAEAIAQRIGKKYGLGRDAILFNSSHTHSAPVVGDMLIDMYPLDQAQKAAIRDYTLRLEDQVVELVGAALKDIAPARLSFARSEASFGVNRRVKKGEGYVIGVNPEGPVDHEVDVLRIERPNGRLRAVLFSYACHNTTLGADNYQIHSDYAGVAQETFEKNHPSVVALFLLGCAGDTNPNPRGTPELANAHGEELAAAVEKALAGRSRDVGGPLHAAFDRVALPFAPFPTREQWQARLQDKDPYRQKHARKMLDIIEERSELPQSYPYPIQVLQFGKDLTLVALAGEVVVDYALRLKRELSPGDVWIAGYCNDVFAYIVSKRVVEEGGYEADNSMIYYGQPGPWSPQAEDVLITKVHELVKKVRAR
jgi:hypothetical protein